MPDHEADARESVLAALPLFAALAPDELHRLAKGCEVRCWPTGAVMLNEGDKARGMLVILQGVAKLVRLSPDGRETVLHLAWRGNTIGEAAVFQGGTFPATALAVEDVRALYLEADALRGMIAENPDLALRMLAALSARLRMFSHKLASQGQGGASRRVAAYLLHRARMEQLKQGDSAPSGLPVVKTGVPRDVLASLLGLARETLSRQLSSLEERGLIRRKGRDIVITNEDGLRALAESAE